MKTNQTIKSKTKTLRAVTYCRTSGKDKTSISSQKEATKKFIKDNKWKFINHYVDKHKSGAKVAGRDDFQQMMKDAANNDFDIIVVYDVTRFARDGCDILYNAKFLRQTFGIHIVDSKGQFDSRDHHKVMTNFIFAGVAEDERLRIMERTIRGRIKNAENGKRWSPKPPAGRSYDEKKGWYVNEEGNKLRALLPRYVKGESLSRLAKEYNLASDNSITRKVRSCQLSGIYIAKFDSPEIGINLEVPVPAIPEIITPELEKRVRNRLTHNRTCNKQNKRKYLLTGFVWCAHCRRSLTGQTPKHSIIYKHTKTGCNFGTIQGSILENHALNYLYGLFLDEPAYNRAVQNALPDDDDRKALEKDIKLAQRQIAQAKTEISNLVNAVAKGADVSLLTSKQNELKSTIHALENRKGELSQTLLSMPNTEQTKRDAKLLRLKLMSKYWKQDWRKLSYEDIRRFLHFLFSDNPKKNGYGIFVDKINSKWTITFEGCTESIDIEELEKTVDEIVPAVDELKNEVKEAEQVLKELRACDKNMQQPSLDKL